MSGLGNNDAGFAIKAEKTCFSNQPHTLSNLVQHDFLPQLKPFQLLHYQNCLLKLFSLV